jgi:hypothetical protein
MNKKAKSKSIYYSPKSQVPACFILLNKTYLLKCVNCQHLGRKREQVIHIYIIRKKKKMFR